jgi:hypothetical protein
MPRWHAPATTAGVSWLPDRRSPSAFQRPVRDAVAVREGELPMVTVAGQPRIRTGFLRFRRLHRMTYRLQPPKSRQGDSAARRVRTGAARTGAA